MTDEIHPEAANPAPGELETVRDFVNTLDVEQPEPDSLARPEDLEAWLAARGLTTRRAQAKPADLKRAIELRDALRDLLRANNGEPLPDDEPIAVVNRAAARTKVGVEFDRDGTCEMRSAASGVDEGIGNLLAIVARAMTDGSWARLKICGADTCQWAFYDKSKNRSGRWCAMAECGNRAKARAFRERRRKSAKSRR